MATVVATTGAPRSSDSLTARSRLRRSAVTRPHRQGKHNVPREGMAADTLEPAGVYFGTTRGTLFASSDSGAHWRPIAEGLPQIQSVEVALAG